MNIMDGTERRKAKISPAVRREVKDYLAITFGLIVFSLGMTLFLLPYQITTGGLSGIALIIYYATGIEVQVSIFVINAILILASMKILGFKFFIKTIFATIVMTYLLWQFQVLFRGPDGELPKILGEGQEFMACVIGATMFGLGIGWIFCNNGSTGGTDIIAAVVNKYRDVSLGRILLLCDIAIISSGYFVFHDWRRVVFGFCTMFIISYMVDYVVNSNRQSVQFLIFSSKHDEIARRISTEIRRGVTLLDGHGWYSKNDIKVIILLARKSQSVAIFRLIKEVDPNAFISQSNVTGVYGEGFDRLKIKEGSNHHQ